MAQGLYLLEKACEFAEMAKALLKPDDENFLFPQIMCGDFNSQPSESTAQVMYFDSTNIEEKPSK
jgi:endonuclease/exonuclease/phosphatase family metal-dependent hydrolase